MSKEELSTREKENLRYAQLLQEALSKGLVDVDPSNDLVPTSNTVASRTAIFELKSLESSSESRSHPSSQNSSFSKKTMPRNISTALKDYAENPVEDQADQTSSQATVNNVVIEPKVESDSKNSAELQRAAVTKSEIFSDSDSEEEVSPSHQNSSESVYQADVSSITSSKTTPELKFKIESKKSSNLWQRFKTGVKNFFASCCGVSKSEEVELPEVVTTFNNAFVEPEILSNNPLFADDRPSSSMHPQGSSFRLSERQSNSRGVN